MVKLIIEDDEGKTTVVPLIRDEISIGRKEGNTIRLTERNVSRHHARLMRHNSAVFIEDLGSYNGLRVNGNRVSGRVAVTEGDRIQIGDYIMGLKLEGEALRRGKDAETAPDQARTTELVRVDLGTQSPPSPAQAPQTEATAMRPRLVCVSANLAGLEFALTKPEAVIGRTDDNDIVLNHRSISRHHCRVTKRNGHFTITDLQSSNGVRVNGGEFHKAELHRGDLVDLGHVRLRFVAADEDFVFERDATVVDTTVGAPPHSGKWIALALTVMLFAGAFVAWQLFSRSEPEAATDITSHQLAGRATDPATSVAREVPDQAARDFEILSKIRTDLANERWDSVLEQCKSLKGDLARDAAADCERARREALWQQTFEEAESLAGKERPSAALEAYRRIPKESVYADKRESSTDYHEMNQRYRQRTLAVIQEHVERGECDLARVKNDKLLELVPAATQGRQLVEKCEPATPARDEQVAVASRNERRRPPTAERGKEASPRRRRPRGRRSPPETKDKESKAPSKEVEEKAAALYAQAQRAYVAGQHSLAIQYARKVLALKPASTDAMRIVGAAACYLGNKELAASAYRSLRGPQRTLLRTVCTRLGVALD